MIIGFKAGNRFRLGDQLTVKIAKVDLQDRQLYFDVLKNHSARGESDSPKQKSATKPIYKGKRKKDRRDKKKRKKRR